MKKLGDLSHRVHAYDTCRYQQRTINILPKRVDTPSGRRYKLSVLELEFGETVNVTEVETELLVDGLFIGCCAVGTRILLLAGKNAIDLAALLEIDDGPLSPSSVHVSTLQITGNVSRMNVPCLWEASGQSAMLSVLGDQGLWLCSLQGETLSVTQLRSRTPETGGLGCAPVRTPAGDWVVAGSLPYSNDIFTFSGGESPKFKPIGRMPGKSSCGTSLAAVRKRYVLGFGGGWGSTMWVLDLETGKCSAIRREGDWHPDTEFAYLELRGRTLYVVGGNHTNSVNAITLKGLKPLIEDEEIRSEFPGKR